MIDVVVTPASLVPASRVAACCGSFFRFGSTRVHEPSVSSDGGAGAGLGVDAFRCFPGRTGAAAGDSGAVADDSDIASTGRDAGAPDVPAFLAFFFFDLVDLTAGSGVCSVSAGPEDASKPPGTTGGNGTTVGSPAGFPVEAGVVDSVPVFFFLFFFFPALDVNSGSGLGSEGGCELEGL